MVHSNNPEIINLLKENYVTPKDQTFCKCFKESIKCHHIEVAKYIEENLLKCDNQNAQEIAVNNCLHFYNYLNFPTIQISTYVVSIIILNLSNFYQMKVMSILMKKLFQIQFVFTSIFVFFMSRIFFF